MGERTVFVGGRVFTLDPTLGDFERADVLIEDSVIVAIGSSLGVTDAHSIDVSGKLLMPGMIDSHRHTWQTALRGLGADWTVLDYLAAVRMKLAPAFTADDVYWSSHAGALEALDHGVTTVVDYAHCINSAEHAEAGLRAFEDSGARGVFSYGFASNDAPSEDRFGTHGQRLAQARALASRAGRESSRVQLGVALTEMQVPWEQTLAEVECARDLGLPITFHSTAWPIPGKSEIERLYDAKLLGPDMLLVHCTHASDDDLRRIADNGAAVCATPETELQMGMGFPVLGRALRHGIRPTLGCDVVCSNNGDPFAMMRLALQVERGVSNARLGLPLSLELRAAQLLPMVTSHAADAIGAGSRIGSLSPGKQADIVVLSNQTTNLFPGALHHGALVTQAHAGNVDSVMVAGRFVKRDGRLVGIDREVVRRKLEAVRHELLVRTGGESQLLSARSRLLQQWNMGQAEVSAGTSA